MLITDFNSALRYVNRLGFAGHGNIQDRQFRLCEATDKLLELSGQTSWFWQTFIPFEVGYNRTLKQFRVKRV